MYTSTQCLFYIFFSFFFLFFYFFHYSILHFFKLAVLQQDQKCSFSYSYFQTFQISLWLYKNNHKHMCCILLLWKAKNMSYVWESLKLEVFLDLRRKQLFEYSLMTLTFRNISFLHLAKNATQSLTKCFIVVVRKNRCAFTGT